MHRPKSFDIESKAQSTIITDTLAEFVKLTAEDKYNRVFCRLTTNQDKVIISKLCNGHYVFDFALLYSFKSNGLIFGAYANSVNEVGYEICNLAALEEALEEAK